MFEGIMSKIHKTDENKNPEELQVESNEQLVEEKKTIEMKKENTITNKEVDFNTSQCIAIGMDMKRDVEYSSKAFFNNKNSKKAKAYLAFQNFLLSLENYEKTMLKNMTYLEFTEKDEQIYTKLKNGFSQYLSKGAHLDEELRESINMVFLDIKKLPSKGHRYWYYKIYIWQEYKLKD